MPVCQPVTASIPAGRLIARNGHGDEFRYVDTGTTGESDPYLERIPHRKQTRSGRPPTSPPGKVT